MKNTKGQMHVLEVLLVATLFTSTVNVAVNILPTSDANNVDEYDLCRLKITSMQDKVKRTQSGYLRHEFTRKKTQSN